MRSGRLPAAALFLLAACPLPQSVPSVPAGSVTPPRIVIDYTPMPARTLGTGIANVIPYDTACPAGKEQPFTLVVTVADENFSEGVECRWFLDYDPNAQQRYQPFATALLEPPTADPFTLRAVPSITVVPAKFLPVSTPAGLHVLELVVSNGFDLCPVAPLPPSPPPCRSPQTTAQNRYEVQSFKWVFVPVPGCAAATTCDPCLP